MPAHITSTMHDSNPSNNSTRPLSYSFSHHAQQQRQPQPQRPLSTSSLSASSTTPVVVLAGKKHPSTPPPPPLPLRSSRRPNSAIAHGIRLFDNSPSVPSSASSTPVSNNHATLTPCATNTQQAQANNNKAQQHHQQRHASHGSMWHKKSQVLDDIDREASNVCEFMEDELYFMWTAINPISTRRTTYLTIDNYLQYTAFFSDFGPFDIADIFRFCCLMKERLELAKSQRKVLCLHTKPDDIKRANAAFALCCYMMLLHDMTPEEAYAPVEYIHPAITSFRDAGCGPVTYTLSILDCLRGLRKGLDRGLLRLDKLNVKEYEHYERVSNGDFNWITPFFIAFAGPKDKMKRETLLRYEAVRTAAGISTPSEEGSDETDTSSKWSFSSTSGGTSRTSSVESSRSSTPPLIHSTIGSELPSGTLSKSDESSEGSEQSRDISHMECPLSISMEASSIDASLSSTSTLPQQGEPTSTRSNSGTDSETEVAKVVRTKKERTRLNKSFRSVLSYFSTHNVQCIIRLNDKTYDKAHFTSRGIEHVDMIYPDGTCPPWYIVERFFEVCERVAMDQGGVVAVHCMAGLGRTGTLIGAYLMRHFDMSARETIAFLRLMRPGSVVGPQQNWLSENEWRIRKRDYQQHQQQFPQSGGQSLQSVQEERQREIQERLIKMQQSHGLTPESTKSSTTVTPAGSTLHTPGTNYEQVFSRANSEGLESTWSEVADEIEGGSLTVLDDEDDEEEAETSGFEDMATTEDESMEEGNMVEDSDDDGESGREQGYDDPGQWATTTTRPSGIHRPSPLRVQHTRRVSGGSLESLMSALEQDPVTDDRAQSTPVGCSEDVNMDVEAAEEREEGLNLSSSLKEHIGDMDYVIPGQPRKQDLSSHRHHIRHHQHDQPQEQQQHNSSSTSSHGHSDPLHRSHRHTHHGDDLQQPSQKQLHHHDGSSQKRGEKLYRKQGFSSHSSDSSSSAGARAVSATTSTFNSSSSSSPSSSSSASGNSNDTGSGNEDTDSSHGKGQGAAVEGGVGEQAHVLRTGSGTTASNESGITTTTTAAAITTGMGGAQGTSHHDRAPCRRLPFEIDDARVCETSSSNAPGPSQSEFESGNDASQPPVLSESGRALLGDNDREVEIRGELVDNQNPQLQQGGRDQGHYPGLFRQEDMEGVKDERDEVEDRHCVSNVQQQQDAHKGVLTDTLRNTHHHQHHGYRHGHRHQHKQEQVPDSPPSFNSAGGNGGGSNAEEEGSGGNGRRELSQETRAGSVEMCR